MLAVFYLFIYLLSYLFIFVSYNVWLIFALMHHPCWSIYVCTYKHTNKILIFYSQVVHSLQACKHILDLSVIVAITLIQQMASLCASRDVWLLFFPGINWNSMASKASPEIFFLLATAAEECRVRLGCRVEFGTWLTNVHNERLPAADALPSMAAGSLCVPALCRWTNAETYTQTPTSFWICVREEGGVLGEFWRPLCTTCSFLRHNTSN